jgi:uncharacterized protein YdeI (YjbR/CyaY-like superfamily)
VSPTAVEVVDGLPVLPFSARADLRAWLEANGGTSAGIWVRLFKQGSGVSSVSFGDLLEEGLCFGWSESQRRRYDDHSYLQRFTPRKARGTTSARNRALIDQLVAAGRMTPAGLAVIDARDHRGH